MLENKIKYILSFFQDELEQYSNDGEYKAYLYEKINKAYEKEMEKGIDEKIFIEMIKKEIPHFISEYERLKENVSLTSRENNTMFGTSINFELIDLFRVSKECNSSEEFIMARDSYFKQLSLDSRFQPIEKFVFPGLSDITLDEIRNIEKNLIKNVDCITPEWAGKMRACIDITKPLIVEGKINEELFNFELLDKTANFARQNGMSMRMHNIIWHKDFRPIFKNASKEEILLFFDVYTRKIYERYGDILYSVDVLNEIVSDNPNEVLRESPWKDKLGDEYYIDILRIAKKNFGNIPLFYNEYGEERESKRNHILMVINRIKEVEKQEGITLLDGIGIQSHYSNQTTDDDIKRAYKDYIKTGKELQITEFDVSRFRNETGYFDYQTNRVFRTVLDCATSCKIRLMNLWGISSKISWLNKEKSTGECLLDENGNITKYSNKLIETYSYKRKHSLQLNGMVQNNENSDLNKGISNRIV